MSEVDYQNKCKKFCFIASSLVLIWWCGARFVHLKMHLRSEVMTSEGPQVKQRHTETHLEMKGDRDIHWFMHFTQIESSVIIFSRLTLFWNHISISYYPFTVFFVLAQQHRFTINYQKSCVRCPKMSALMIHGKNISIQIWRNMRVRNLAFFFLEELFLEGCNFRVDSKNLFSQAFTACMS